MRMRASATVPRSNGIPSVTECRLNGTGKALEPRFASFVEG
ncbi:hypothetical protein [Sphaerisporangium dianthi]|uniref:DUF397 domain-containing protein n=1 Tax=Sphaerisporangium dianthi TaxID=1436120 RepID=A0ABV9CNN7_9ACTN